MKQIIIVSFLTVILISSINAQQFEKQPVITVNGEAVVKVQPDQIIITFGIETWDTEIMFAKQKNNDIMKKALSVIKNSGIQDKDIQTDYLSIEPRYDSNYDKKNFIGYFVRNTFVVTLSDANKVEDLVTNVLESGVNFIHGINFQTTEFKKFREQARELALNAVKEKAEKMAGALGQHIGKGFCVVANGGLIGLPGPLAHRFDLFAVFLLGLIQFRSRGQLLGKDPLAELANAVELLLPFQPFRRFVAFVAA